MKFSICNIIQNGEKCGVIIKNNRMYVDDAILQKQLTLIKTKDENNGIEVKCVDYIPTNYLQPFQHDELAYTEKHVTSTIPSKILIV